MPNHGGREAVAGGELSEWYPLAATCPVTRAAEFSRADGHAVAATHTIWFVVRLKRHGSWSRHAIRRARRRRQSSDRVVTWPMLRLTADGRGARALAAGRRFG